MGRRSLTGGVVPLGHRRIQFDFTIDGVRYHPTLPWIPHETNLRRARALLVQSSPGRSASREDFPTFRFRHRLPVLLRAQTCGQVFDAFLQHEAARVARDDLAPVTLTAHTQILNSVWRPAIGALPFLGVRYSMLVKVVDAHRWTKKTYNNVISALRRAFDFGFQDHPERHNPSHALRSARIGKKDRPVVDPFSIQDAETLIAALHRDWGEAQGNYDEFRFFGTLKRLAIRYRKPYAARHSSVSWNLMMGRNPLFVAQQHGHGILTMLSVYAAWTEGALPADITAIRRAMRGPPTPTTSARRTAVSTPRDAQLSVGSLVASSLRMACAREKHQSARRCERRRDERIWQ